MGESPREQASNQFANMVNGMIGSRGTYGMGAANAQMGAISPIFSQGKKDLNSGIDKSINNLNLGLSNRMAGIGGQLGESLISAGVPAGQGRGTAFASAMSPAIAGTQEGIAGLEQTRAMTLADFAKTEGLTLADLMKSSEQIIMQLLQAQMGGISGMKNSTGFGDAFSVIQSLGKVFAPLIAGLGGGVAMPPGGGAGIGGAQSTPGLTYAQGGWMSGGLGKR